MENLFGTKIRSLREASGILQRQVAYHLDIDSPMLSNVERGERKARREWIPKLAQLLKTNEDELLTAWLADRIQELVQDEKVAKDSIKAVAMKMGMKVK
ncbi:MAG: transcriptional regulator [Bacteroidetes bacterium B1(2017)]|nr:MAG: transcriptional regulator [Bacteroidetes bacterium B1(2017)]